jgi:L-ascorbate metabolism protein UlaG (beta-lactamase superfamily)
VKRGLALVTCAIALAIGVRPADAAPRRVPLATFTPLPPAPPVSDEVRQLRDQLLGDHWRDPAYVTLHWTGVSSFVITIGGHLLLFDAWEIIGAVDGYLPISRDQLAALQPEAVLVGHGHFDHAGDLGLVAGRANATVVGSEEICTVAEESAMREGAPTDFSCAITGTMETPAPGVAQPLQLFADLPPITILQHVHSDTRPPGNGNALDPFAPVMDPEPYIEHLNTDPEELERFLAQQQESNQGGTWLYHLRIGAFTLLVGDSAGPIFEYPEVRAALDRFPDCVDVLANAILGFDQPVSGLQDPVAYVANVHPRVFLPTHGDAWAPVVSAGQAQYRDELEAGLAALEHPPEVDFLIDPDDYLAERAYRVDDPGWAAPMPGSSCAAGTAGAPTAPAATDGGSETTPATGWDLPSVAIVALAIVLGRRLLVARAARQR